MKYANSAEDYYSRFGTWLGYTIILGRAQHFGRYDQTHTTNKAALRNSLDKLRKELNVRDGDDILDAGCGQGVVSIYLAEHADVNVTGITITPREVDVANMLAKKTKLKGTVQFELGDYTELQYADETFDIVFTYETLFHCKDVAKTLREFYRVLRPGGKVHFVEYEFDHDKFSDSYRETYDFVRKHWGGYGTDQFGVGAFINYLANAGFTDIKEYDITQEVYPSMQRIARLTAPLRFLTGWNKNWAKHFVNNVGGTFYRDAVDEGVFRYVVYTAKKGTDNESRGGKL